MMVAARDRSTARDQAQLRPRRVLFADDCRAIRQSVRSLLERHHFDVVGEAADGAEAVRLAETLRPDVVIVDRVMPRLGGFDAARAMTRAPGHPAVILLAAHLAAHHIVMGTSAGIRGFVSKVDAADELARAIEEVISGRTFFSAAATRVMQDAHLTDAGNS